MLDVLYQFIVHFPQNVWHRVATFGPPLCTVALWQCILEAHEISQEKYSNLPTWKFPAQLSELSTVATRGALWELGWVEYFSCAIIALQFHMWPEVSSVVSSVSALMERLKRRLNSYTCFYFCFVIYMLNPVIDSVSVAGWATGICTGFHWRRRTPRQSSMEIPESTMWGLIYPLFFERMRCCFSSDNLLHSRYLSYFIFLETFLSLFCCVIKFSLNIKVINIIPKILITIQFDAWVLVNLVYFGLCCLEF